MESSDIKQVIVVRKDLNMRKGKIAAQVAHASLKIIFDRLQYSSCGIDNDLVYRELKIRLYQNSPLEDWLMGLFTKIVVGCDTEEELIKIYSHAMSLDLPCCLITDAGLTEFNNIPTHTCVAIGPETKYKLDVVTGHLKLL